MVRWTDALAVVIAGVIGGLFVGVLVDGAAHLPAPPAAAVVSPATVVSRSTSAAASRGAALLTPETVRRLTVAPVMARATLTPSPVADGAAVRMTPSATPAPATIVCDFTLGFAALRDLIGRQTVGDCLENSWYDAEGNARQLTTGGVLLWQKRTNWTAFTDGVQTWTRGPRGLQSRPADERLDWELP